MIFMHSLPSLCDFDEIHKSECEGVLMRRSQGNHRRAIRGRWAQSGRRDHRGNLFFIRTNRGAKNFRIVTAPVDDPSEKNWKELVRAPAGREDRGHRRLRTAPGVV
jgi:protease II